MMNKTADRRALKSIVREPPTEAIIEIGLPYRDEVAIARTHVVIFTMNELEDEVLAVLAAYFDPRVAHVVLRQLGAPQPSAEGPLTPRELDVLRLIAEGVGNINIAERLHIGLGTVKGHIRDILVKLSAADRTHAVVKAMRRGYL
jgi:NarL family two-component system response regulator LiaR